MPKRWVNRPEGSNWGDFGDDDQLGRLNLITPEVRRKAAAEVIEGRAFCLSLPLNLPGGNLLNPRRHPPVLQPSEENGNAVINFPYARREETATDVVCDDAVLLWTQYSTQWDALAHVGQTFDADGDGEAEFVFYNGYRAGEHVRGPVDYSDGDAPTGHRYDGVSALGIENYAEHSMQGRGVLVDLRRHFGDDRHYVSHEDLMRVMAADNVQVEPGDMLLLHTGFGARIMEMAGKPDVEVLQNACAVLNGRDAALQDWVRDSGVAALISDNYAVEGLPSKPGAGERYAALPLHELCLFKLGLPLGELWYLSALADWLAANDRSRFLLTAPPLRLPGAVGSPATPIATV